MCSKNEGGQATRGGNKLEEGEGDKVTNERICQTNSRNHPQSRSILRDCATSPRDDYLIERSRRRLVLLNLGDLKADYDVNKKDFRILLKYTILQIVLCVHSSRILRRETVIVEPAFADIYMSVMIPGKTDSYDLAFRDCITAIPNYYCGAKLVVDGCCCCQFTAPINSRLDFAHKNEPKDIPDRMKLWRY